MIFDWQHGLVMLAVAGALAYVLRRSYLVLWKRQASGCGGGCAKCPSSSSAANDSLVSLDPLTPSSRQSDPSA